MIPSVTRLTATASAAALILALGLPPAMAQQVIEQPPAVTEPAPLVQENGADAPLTAPETEARRNQVMPESFADLVDQVSPAVVNINTTALVEAPTAPAFPEGSPFSDLFRDFGFPMPNTPPNRRGFGEPRRANALGSGFVISDDGFIVTNNHVIEGADQIEIEFRDGARRTAEVVGTDRQTDIALLKVDAEDLPFVAFGDSDAARVGDWVLALGNPLGQGFSASTGIVSARGRALSGTYDDFIQTDASINRGNSGGPLFNLDGEVIGVNTAILSPNGGSIGIGFSMASNVVSTVIDQLREFGETRRGWLGVKIQDVTPEIAETLGLDAGRGALVTDVPEGPSAEAGIRAGDVILSFDGEDVSDTRDLVARVALAPVGEAVDVTVLRDGSEEVLQVTLGRRELAEGLAAGGEEGTPSPASPSGQVLGMELESLNPELAEQLGIESDAQGLVIRSVDPASEAASRGLAAGDVIVEAGQQAVASVAELEDRLDEAREAGRRSVLLLIRRGGEPRFVPLPVED